MAGISFHEQISTANGTYELPHATYASTEYTGADGAAKAVKAEADKVVDGSRVVASSGSDWQGLGLKKVS
jgi:hypothetical protein